MVRRTLASLAVAMTVSSVAAAQSAADYRRKLDELEPRWRAASAAATAAEQARQVKAQAITIERGSLRVIADSVVAEHVVAGVEMAARQIEETFGSSARMLLDNPVVIRHRAEVKNGDTTDVIGVRGRGREQTISLEDPAAARVQLAATLGGAVVVAVLHTALDDSLRHWFHTPFPAGVQARHELGRAYLDLVTASTSISRRCLAGDLPGCRQLLGLAPVENVVVDGLTAAQRRSLVASAAARLRTPGKAAEFDRCIANDDTACVARLAHLPTESRSHSVSSADTRRSFARLVLDRGGTDAYARLRANDTIPLAARFAAAGGEPIDSLVATWRASVLAVRPSPSSVTPTTALATLAWIAACGALALRSSRWR